MINNFKNKKIIILISTVSGIISSFALPPYNFIIFNFLSLSILFLVILKNSSNKIISFLIGLSYGYGYFISSTYWITNSLTHDEAFKSLIPIALICIPLLLSIFYGFATLTISFFKIDKNLSSIFIFSLIFTLLEYLRSTIFTGFPWNLHVYSLTNFIKSLQILSVVGTHSLNMIAITFFVSPVIFLFNTTNKKKVIYLIITMSIIYLNNLYGDYIINNQNKFTKNLNYKIKIVSPKIDIKRFLNSEDPEKRLDELISFVNLDDKTPSLYIFPEGILSGIFLDELNYFVSKTEKIFNEGDKIIIGINSVQNKNIYNSLVLVDNELNILKIYNKNNLVPFGEFLPFENLLSKFGLKKITSGYQSFSSSNKREFIFIDNLKILPLICYEIIYTGNLTKINEEYDLIVNISEDGWFGDSIGPHQHFTHSIFRAIEEGKNVVRSSNNGISGHINSVGKIINLIESTKSGVIEVETIEISKKTLFSQYGNKIFFYFVLFYITLIFFLKRKGFK